MEKLAFLARSDEWYDKIGISHNPDLREDGMRTDGLEGTYEWWYFDAEYENGIKAVLGFYTKDGVDAASPPNPTAILTLNMPDGNIIYKRMREGEGSAIRAAKDICDVQIRENTCKHENGVYKVHFDDDGIVYDFIMKPRVPMWRPGTGHWYFGVEQEKFFAWVVAQPSADIEAELTVNGETIKLRGKGYHDHNWGNAPMSEVFNHWYWCRASIDDYTIISCDLVSHEQYGYVRLPVCLFAKGDQIIDDREDLVTVERGDTIYHPKSGKFMDNILIFARQIDDDTGYRISYNRTGDLDYRSLLYGVMPKEEADKLISKGINPTYIRCAGSVSLDLVQDGQTTHQESEAIWEQMFFGSNKDATING